jgi:serine/threonine protein kinase
MSPGELGDYQLKDHLISRVCAESLADQSATTASDVWSYGVTLWEILTGCATDPYSDQQIFSIPALVQGLKTGAIRLALPQDCPPVLRGLVERCLDPDAAKRPSAEEIVEELSKAAPGPSVV